MCFVPLVEVNVKCQNTFRIKSVELAAQQTARLLTEDKQIEVEEQRRRSASGYEGVIHVLQLSMNVHYLMTCHLSNEFLRYKILNGQLFALPSFLFLHVSKM